MHIIYKYVLPLGDEVILAVPEQFRPLHVGEQDGQLCLWALVNTEAMPSHRRIHVYGTGHPIENLDPMKYYIGTVAMANGLVWHVADGGRLVP